MDDLMVVDAFIKMKEDGVKSEEVTDELVEKFVEDVKNKSKTRTSETVFIKYVRDIKPITPSEVGDWIDLRSGVDIDLDAGESAIIPLGVCMQLPGGYEAIIAPRSSTYKKWGIIQSNSIGVIDESYKGDDDEWGIPVIALRRTHIHKNDRICQFRLIEHQPKVNLVKLKKLYNENRNGFGSTGNN